MRTHCRDPPGLAAPIRYPLPSSPHPCSWVFIPKMLAQSQSSALYPPAWPLGESVQPALLADVLQTWPRTAVPCSYSYLTQQLATSCPSWHLPPTWYSPCLWVQAHLNHCAQETSVPGLKGQRLKLDARASRCLAFNLVLPI